MESTEETYRRAAQWLSRREQGDWTVKRVTWRDPSDAGEPAAAPFDQARAATSASFIRAQ